MLKSYQVGVSSIRWINSPRDDRPPVLQYGLRPINGGALDWFDVPTEFSTNHPATAAALATGEAVAWVILGTAALGNEGDVLSLACQAMRPSSDPRWEPLYTHPSASTSADLTSAAQAVITARDNFGWSTEVDEKIEAMRGRLATSAAQPLTDAECLTAWEACDETGYLEWTTVVQRAFAEKNGIRLADDAGGEL